MQFYQGVSLEVARVSGCRARDLTWLHSSVILLFVCRLLFAGVANGYLDYSVIVVLLLDLNVNRHYGE